MLILQLLHDSIKYIIEVILSNAQYSENVAITTQLRCTENKPSGEVISALHFLTCSLLSN